MQKPLACLLLLLLAASGCAMHYDITVLPIGSVIRAASKPKLSEDGYYVFKDALGQEVRINRVRVRKIEAVNPGDPPSKTLD